MKKNILLKIACLIQFIFIFLTSIEIIISKFNEESVFQIFILIIDLIFLVILFKESLNEEKYFLKNNLKIKFIGIWFFIDSIIPGILCFIFLKRISKKYNKNKLELPVIEQKKYNKIDIIKGLILLLLFILIQFILPITPIGKKLPGLIYYLIIFLFTLFICFKDIKYQFKIFISNKKTYFKYVIISYLKMLGIVFLCSLPIVLLNGGEQSANQELINEMFTKNIITTFILSVFYAPLIEELIFRHAIANLIKNKWLFILISGILFGSLHMVDKLTSIMDVFYIVQYSALGICLAYFYKKTNNIFVSISIHFIQNFLASILSIILLF